MAVSSQTYRELQLDLAARLTERMPPLEAAREAGRWFTEGLGLSAEWLQAHGGDPVPEALRHRLGAWLRRGTTPDPWTTDVG